MLLPSRSVLILSSVLLVVFPVSSATLVPTLVIGAATIASAIAMPLPRTSGRGTTYPTSRFITAGELLLVLDFARNQSWLLLLPLFQAHGSVAGIWLARQLLTPPLMLMNAWRKSIEDVYLGRSEELLVAHLRALVITLVTFIATTSMVAFSLSAIDFPFPFAQPTTFAAWSVVIAGQELRGFALRVSLNLRSFDAAVAACLSWLPPVCVGVAAFSLPSLPLYYLLLGLGTGDLLAATFLFRSRGRKRLNQQRRP